ncbi:MAG: Ig-like domain-containing protein, partial [Clostridia bacterium]|nr:Ig-like domain-containing protein [Clostridia bacterium]
EGRVRFTPDNLGWNEKKIIGYTNGSTFPSLRPAYVENAYELINVPGEWYINKKDGYLYYKLREFDDPKTMVASLPVVEGAFFVAGESPDKKIHHLKFDNLAFQYSAWSYPDTLPLYKDHQAGELLNYRGDGRMTGSRETAAVTVCDAAYVDVTNCTFRHLGGSGLGIREIYQHMNVTGNHIYDVSGSGLTIGAAVKEDDGSLFTTYFKPKNYKHYRIYNTFNNNLIHDYGTDYKGSVGLHSSPGLKESEICHNEIYSSPYTGIHFGWEWATRDVEGTGTRDVKIDENYVHDMLNTWIYDGACMYFNGATGASPENPISISRNYMENTSNGTANLYLDNGTYFYEAKENVFENRDYTKDVYVCNNVGKTVKAPRWLYLQWDSHDNYVHDNYVQEPAYVDDTSNGASVVEDTFMYNGEWSAEAQAIIDNAGLESAYLAKHPDSIQKIDLNGKEKHTFVNIGETYQLNVRGGMRKMHKTQIPAEQLMFASSDESVATVSENGLITATGYGRCYIYIEYLDGDVIRSTFLDVFSGDSVENVTADAEQYNIVAGVDAKVNPIVTTKYGGSIDITSATYKIENPDIVSVSEDGVIKGLADGTTTVTGIFEAGGETFESTFPVTVVSYNKPDSKKYLETAEKLTSGAFFTANGWSLGAKKVDDGLKIAHSQAAYYRQKPGNTLYSFDVAINNPNTWPSFALRASNISGDYTNSKTYLLGIKTDQFELQRFDSGKRTMIFGDASFNPLGGPGAPNSLNGKTMFEYGKRYSVTLGTIREEEGVRILFFVNGEPVFDYVDKAEGYIAEDGYLGIYAFQGDFTLYPFSDLSYEE